MADPAGGIVTQQAPVLVAHRGFAGAYPENTLPAIEAALRCAVLHVEFDVQLSEDGVAVVLHDTTLKRTGGVDANALELTAAKLRRIEVNESARLGDRFQGVCIPLLTDALTLIGGYPGAHAFVEVKRESLVSRGRRATVERVVGDIEKTGTADRCTLISFDKPALEIARDLGLGSIGWVLDACDEGALTAAAQLAPQFLFCDYRLLPAAPTPLQQGSWQWAIYEVGTRSLAQSLAMQGVQFIETMQLDKFVDTSGLSN